MTGAPGDETTLARRAIDDGVTTLIVLGGDGTWSKAARALVESRAACRLVLLAAGTGNDFAKSVGTPAGDFEAMARLLADGAERRIDVGVIDDTPFLNIAGFGFDAAVLADLARIRWPTGNASYALAALRQLFGYRGFSARIEREDGHATEHFLGLFFANGRRFGGSFQIAPKALLSDGRLDLIALGEMTPLRRARLFAAALGGRHLGRPEVREQSVTTLRVAFDEPPLYQADGDLYQARTRDVEVRCLPSALCLVAPAERARLSAD